MSGSPIKGTMFNLHQNLSVPPIFNYFKWCPHWDLSEKKKKHTWCILEASQDISALMGGISEVFRHILHFNVAASSAVIFNLMKYSSALPFDQSALCTVTSPLLGVCLFHLYLKNVGLSSGAVCTILHAHKKTHISLNKDIMSIITSWNMVIFASLFDSFV